MKLKLTNGTDTLQAVIAEDMDKADCDRIRASKRPVTTALRIVKQRLGLDGWYPVPGLALEGL